MFDNPFFHTVVFGTVAYIAIIFMLRLSGKRTLSKWNSFDFVVTIAFGSMSSRILTKNYLNIGHTQLQLS